MNFYKRFIGDITAKTGGLSMAQMGAYDRLLDHYYSTEAPIAADEVYRICRAMSKAEKADVDIVLAKFWDVGAAGFTQSKADEVIAKALPLIEAARENGKRGGRPRKPKTKDEPSGFQKQNPEETSVVKATQSQIPNQIPSEANASGGEPPTDRELVFATGVPLLTTAGVSEKNARSMLAMLSKRHGERKVVDAISQTARDHAGEPVSWLQTILSPKPGKHTGFDTKDYNAGVTDGRLV